MGDIMHGITRGLVYIWHLQPQRREGGGLLSVWRPRMAILKVSTYPCCGTPLAKHQGDCSIIYICTPCRGGVLWVLEAQIMTIVINHSL